jgi:hypothetical protein
MCLLERVREIFNFNLLLRVLCSKKHTSLLMFLAISSYVCVQTNKNFVAPAM